MKTSSASIELSPQELRAFAAEGYLGPKPLLSRAQSELIMRYLRLGQHPTPPEWDKARGVSEPFIFEIATYPPVLAWLGQLLGPDVILWGASVVDRRPGQTHLWHTDIETAAPAARCVSLWIGLENVGRHSALQLVPGSHRFGKPIQQAAHERGLRRADLAQATALALALEQDAAARIVEPDLADGAGLLFDGRIWHGSNNTSPNIRTALLLQFAEARTAIYMPDFSQLEWPFRLRAQPRPPCIRVAGAAIPGVNRLVPAPAATEVTLATAVHELALPLEQDRKRGWRPYPQFKGRTPVVGEMGCHVSVLSSGCSPHPPYAHLEEELLVVLEGEAELLIPGGPDDPTPRLERVRPGSWVYYPAYQHHTLRNPGPAPVTYLMFKWRSAPDETREPLGTHVVRLPLATGRGDRPDAFRTEVLCEGPTAFLGKLHAHLSELQPGGGYAPHVDAHDVALIVLAGRIETAGRSLAPHSVAYFAAGEPHGMRNTSAEPARYLVFEFHAPPPIAGVARGGPPSQSPAARPARRSILIVSDQHFLPDRNGGRESSIHELACLWQRAGYRVAVLASRPQGRELRSLGERIRFHVKHLGWRAPYPVIRSDDVIGHMNELLRAGTFERALINVHSPHKVLDVTSAEAHQYMVYVRDVQTLTDVDPRSLPPQVTVVANSDFCAQRVAARIGRPVHVVEPYVERDNYVTRTTGRYVTFVNPVQLKGVDLAVEIARACPEIPFLFLEGWPLGDARRQKLRARLEGIPNVRLRRPVRDMRAIYRQTRILLVPSQWEESWGRVVVEAQFSGIPAVASDVGGLAQNVQDAGLVLDAKDPVEAWVCAIRALWRDGAAYDKVAECARRRAEAYWASAAPSALELAELLCAP